MKQGELVERLRAASSAISNADKCFVPNRSGLFVSMDVVNELQLAMTDYLADAASGLAELEEANRVLREALEGVEPYVDAIVCYASTMGEHEPNRIAYNVRAALTPSGEQPEGQS